jgi:CO/xanthine dehydrogenase Mo-binding subunit
MADSSWQAKKAADVLKITWDEGQNSQVSSDSNFHDYEMLRLAHMPRIESVIVPSDGFWGGIGEPATPPLCNAIFAATGKRVRALPIKNQDLQGV